jgi:gamma-glutamylaminecyclotransferase
VKSTQPTLLFVYGTLKRGCRNHRQLADQTFVGDARTAPGFRLYNLGEYPGLVPVPTDRDGVRGEVWSVDAAGLKRLDRFEGVQEGLYRREPIPLEPPFADQKVHAYIYELPIETAPEVGPEWKE